MKHKKKKLVISFKSGRIEISRNCAKNTRNQFQIRRFRSTSDTPTAVWVCPGSQADSNRISPKELVSIMLRNGYEVESPEVQQIVNLLHPI